MSGGRPAPYLRRARSVRVVPAPRRTARPSAALFTEDLFATGNDDDNRAAVLGVAAEALALAGVAVHGPRGDVDKVLKGLRPHP
ncbi:DUF2000 family protein [Nocardiopsis sp. NPDC006198]|uniref:DUF2000 family protein n=1 Tax=Nocardiopsis sp. NPDC006198 TaxID=3154472 RepID=UPI0033B81D29